MDWDEYALDCDQRQRESEDWGDEPSYTDECIESILEGLESALLLSAKAADILAAQFVEF
jgi:hypothetical protein